MFVPWCWAVVSRSSFLLRREVAIRLTQATIIQTGWMAEQGSAFPEFAAAPPIKSMRLPPHSRGREAVIGYVAAVKDGMKKQPQRWRAAVQRSRQTPTNPGGVLVLATCAWCSTKTVYVRRAGSAGRQDGCATRGFCDDDDDDDDGGYSIHHIHPSLVGSISWAKWVPNGSPRNEGKKALITSSRTFTQLVTSVTSPEPDTRSGGPRAMPDDRHEA